MPRRPRGGERERGLWGRRYVQVVNGCGGCHGGRSGRRILRTAAPTDTVIRGVRVTDDTAERSARAEGCADLACVSEQPRLLGVAGLQRSSEARADILARLLQAFRHCP